MTISDDDIEKVARRMCVELGLDPDERRPHSVTTSWLDTDWPEGGCFVPDVCIYEERWRVWRRSAARAIAAQRAVQS